jgi:hypothetical protein
MKMRPFAYRSSSFLASCVLTASLVVTSVAQAAGVSPIDATAAQKRVATEHFTTGKHALESKDLETAVSELRASIEVVDSPNARLELARALRDSGNLGDAWAEYWRAAETATRLAPKEERYAKTAEAATNEREELATRLAFVEVTVLHAPADGTLKVGGRLVPSDEWGGPVVVSPGATDVVLTSSAGAELARITVNATVGQTTPASLDAQPPAVAAAPAGREADEMSGADKAAADDHGQAPAQPAGSTPADRTKLRPFAYVAAGVGVAGLATFAVLGLLSNSTYSDLQSACPHGCPPDRRSEIDRGILEQTLANVGLGVGLVGIAAGTTLFLLSIRPDATSAGAALVVAPGYLGVRGTL